MPGSSRPQGQSSNPEDGDSILAIIELGKMDKGPHLCCCQCYQAGQLPTVVGRGEGAVSDRGGRPQEATRSKGPEESGSLAQVLVEEEGAGMSSGGASEAGSQSRRLPATLSLSVQDPGSLLC